MQVRKGAVYDKPNFFRKIHRLRHIVYGIVNGLCQSGEFEARAGESRGGAGKQGAWRGTSGILSKYEPAASAAAVFLSIPRSCGKIDHNL